MKSNTLTIEELNSIQDEWMKLDCNAPEKEKQRVFKLMEKMPSSYVSLSADGTTASVMQHNLPITNTMPAKQAIEYAKSLAKERPHQMQTRFAWQCPKWIELNQ